MQGGRKHRVFDSRIPTRDEGFIYTVSIPFKGSWNLLCADIMEVFGLPGNRYTSHFKPQELEFYFKSEKDASLCKILLSEKI